MLESKALALDYFQETYLNKPPKSFMSMMVDNSFIILFFSFFLRRIHYKGKKLLKQASIGKHKGLPLQQT
ncbi:hypothetical protein THIOM_005750 [Candidatus Thiomargarita nelsonii]|uniref:Uncharacterized protein n=1 Tax=Candidatus Thiomargarita nelsonii TaxID=1003181 RepID=A0A176RSC1_9GAMM|nr:hypothetical protein THIOM_005750 [Candidatus Thiomargarita nelsonii]